MSLLPRRASLSLALGLLLWAGPLSAARAADDFQRYLNAALTLYEDFKYEQALAQLERARSVAHGVEQDVTVSLYEGIIHEQGGQRNKALAAFEAALLLDPKAKLPLPDLSPKVEADFETVRRSVKAKLARREPTETPPVSKPAVPEVKTDRPERPAPPATPLASTTPALMAGTTGVRETSRGVPRAIPVALLGVSVVAAGVGAYFGVTANQQSADARASPYRDDALAKLGEARSTALKANVLYGTAGVALAGAVVTWLLGHGSEPTPSVEDSRP